MWLESLRKMKAVRGLTTAEIAAGSGIPEPTLEKLFAGKTKDPKLPTMQKLVHFLGFTLDDLESIKEEPPTTSKDDDKRLSVDEVVSAFVSAGIVKPGQDLSDADLRFLVVIINSITAWFASRYN